MIYNVENKIFDDVLGWGGEGKLALQSKQIIYWNAETANCQYT